ncbi:MAG: hypothetical protein GXY52_00350 [Chloroflexi bacterium]|nr:hypothetical protein [Chloroflexota bacterium]
MSEPGILNIINFIRGYEPRDPRLDLVEPVAQQIALVQRHGLAGTWLIQYDALQQSRFTELLASELDERQEVGGWFEMNQPLVERAGLPWRGRFAWDWHAHVAFSIGYTPSERERLADTFMQGFHAVWGRYPASVGSWLLDAHVMAYLAERYAVDAFCICKEQWGTDGYTVWGGYYNQAYYPSRRNMLMPAQTTQEQIGVPLFRMLGSDPIYQYDAASTANGQTVVTLEPVYTHRGGGGDPAWVRWFLRTIYETPAVSFGYTQMGQENSFGWPAMRDGLNDQIPLAAEMQRQGKLRVMTLGDAGRWFKHTYAHTPTSAITALEDWRSQGRGSVWYCSQHYRINWLYEDHQLAVRDVQRFDECYAERYLQEVCPTKDCTYDALPLVDGLLWNARVRFVSSQNGDASPLTGGVPSVEESGENLEMRWDSDRAGTLQMTLTPAGVNIRGQAEGWELQMRWHAGSFAELQAVHERALECLHEGFCYRLGLRRGRFQRIEECAISILPENGIIEFDLMA